MNNLDIQLKELYKKILSKNRFKPDRTNIGTKSIFGHQMRFDLREGFPLTTLRKIHLKSLIHELLWFLESYDEKYNKFGNTNIRYLLENGVTFWTDWCYEKYRKEMFKKHQENDLIDEKTVKPFKIMNMKDFEKKIVEDDYFALKWGELGPIYGKQWKDFGGHEEIVEKSKIYQETKGNTKLVDVLGTEKVHIKGINQIDEVINTLLENPNSRRMLVNTWNVSDLDDMLLQPCHIMFQFYTEVLEMDERIDLCIKTTKEKDLREYMFKNDIDTLDEINRDPRKQVKILDHFNTPERYIDCQLYIRSNDIYLGNPYNIASYALLLHMIAQVVNMVPRELVYTIGDAHIYSNSMKAVEELLKREERSLPTLKINPDIQNIYDFRYEDFEIKNYNPHENIKVDVAV